MRLDEINDEVERLCSIVANWPQESRCYFQQQHEIALAELPAGMTVAEVEVALQLWDLHSGLSAYLLLVGWRSDQLARLLQHSLANWQLVNAAAAARSLIETAAAFSVESAAFCKAWEHSVSQGISTAQAATRARLEIQAGLIQALMGTRQPELLEGNLRFRRTNVLTFIDTAAKASPESTVRSTYDMLCDVVHPSFGSNECFWTEVGYSDEKHQLRILLARNARGRSELPATVCAGSIWAISTILNTIEAHRRMCNSMASLGKLTHIPELGYFGLPEICSQ